LMANEKTGNRRVVLEHDGETWPSEGHSSLWSTEGGLLHVLSALIVET
jgi:hypothetical protein